MSWWTTLRNKVEGTVKEEFTAHEKELVAWAHNLFVQITPAVKQAAKDAVAAAAGTSGDAESKAIAAFGAAAADLSKQGLPVVTNAIKGAIEIEYANLVAPVGTVAAPVTPQ